MRSVRFILAAVLVAGLALVGCKRNGEPTQEPDFDKTLDPQRHRFAQHRFSIRFPREFTPDKSDDPKTVVLMTNRKTGANVNIRVAPVQPGSTLDDVVASIRHGLSSQVEKLELHEEGEFTAGGLRCVWLQLTHGLGNHRVEAVGYVIKRQSDVIMVFGTATKGEMGVYRPIFDDCVRSLQFE